LHSVPPGLYHVSAIRKLRDMISTLSHVFSAVGKLKRRKVRTSILLLSARGHTWQVDRTQ
jgi:hypothetical protein